MLDENTENHANITLYFICHKGHFSTPILWIRLTKLQVSIAHSPTSYRKISVSPHPHVCHPPLSHSSLHISSTQSSNEHLEITGLVEKQYYSFIQNSQILYFLPFQVSLHTISRSSNQTAVKSHLIKFKAKIKQMLAE